MEKVKVDLKGMSHVDMEPKLAGRAIGMILSPLPPEKRQRHFMLSHGELIHEDEARDAEFEDDDELEDEIVDSSEEE
jgi:translation initiation factor IF-3